MISWLPIFPRSLCMINSTLTRVGLKTFTDDVNSPSHCTSLETHGNAEIPRKVSPPNEKRVFAEVSERNTFLAVSQNPGYSAEYYARNLFRKAHSCEINVFLWQLKRKSELGFERKVDGSKVWFSTKPAHIERKVKEKFMGEKAKCRKAYVPPPASTHRVRYIEDSRQLSRSTRSVDVNTRAKAPVIGICAPGRRHSRSKSGGYLSKLRKIYKCLQAQK